MTYRGSTIYNPVFVYSVSDIPTSISSGVVKESVPYTTTSPVLSSGDVINVLGSDLNSNPVPFSYLNNGTQFDDDKIYKLTAKSVRLGISEQQPLEGAYTRRKTFYVVVEQNAAGVRSISCATDSPKISAILQNTSSPDKATIAGINFENLSFVTFEFPNGVKKIARISSSNVSLSNFSTENLLETDDIVEDYLDYTDSSVVTEELVLWKNFDNNIVDFSTFVYNRNSIYSIEEVNAFLLSNYGRSINTIQFGNETTDRYSIANARIISYRNAGVVYDIYRRPGSSLFRQPR